MCVFSQVQKPWTKPYKRILFDVIACFVFINMVIYQETMGWLVADAESSSKGKSSLIQSPSSDIVIDVYTIWRRSAADIEKWLMDKYKIHLGQCLGHLASMLKSQIIVEHAVMKSST